MKPLYDLTESLFILELDNLESVTFSDIVAAAVRHKDYNANTEAGRHKDYNANTKRGTKILKTEGECNSYIEDFFQKHYYKIMILLK